VTLVPVHCPETRKYKEIEPARDSIKNETALAARNRFLDELARSFESSIRRQANGYDPFLAIGSNIATPTALKKLPGKKCSKKCTHPVAETQQQAPTDVWVTSDEGRAQERAEITWPRKRSLLSAAAPNRFFSQNHHKNGVPTCPSQSCQSYVSLYPTRLHLLAD
jgi:hypothetical protein